MIGGDARTVVVDQLLDIAHDLSIAAMGNGGHLLSALPTRLEDGRGLRVQHERHS